MSDRIATLKSQGIQVNTSVIDLKPDVAAAMIELVFKEMQLLFIPNGVFSHENVVDIEIFHDYIEFSFGKFQEVLIGLESNYGKTYLDSVVARQLIFEYKTGYRNIATGDQRLAKYIGIKYTRKNIEMYTVN